MANYKTPPPDFFPASAVSGPRMVERPGAEIAAFLSRGGLPCCCINSAPGPQADLFTFAPADFYKLPRLPRLLAPLESWTGARVQIADKAPPGAFSLLVQRTAGRVSVSFADCIQSAEWTQAGPGAALIGAGIGGRVQIVDILTAPHLLIAGQTGAGKSVLLNNIIGGLLLKNTPKNARFVMVDPKKVEFSRFRVLPHVRGGDMVTRPGAARLALENLCAAMDRRYTGMTWAGLKTWTRQHTYIFIDELADLMLTAGPEKKAVENCIIRLAQKGRAAGYHLIIATQSPRAAVITGLISANIPTKISLTVSSVRESVLILGHKGAERLAGAGDCIIKSPKTGETRTQAAFISDSDLDRLITFYKRQKSIFPF